MPPRVLVVDDSPTIRRVVSSVLTRHGFDALEAGDGQSALDALLRVARGADRPDAEAPIDLVLVDFVMPKMNGFQLCRVMRQSPELRATPVVLMSAKSDRIREHFVQQTGAIDAITKPFDARALVAVVENAIRRTDAWRSRGEPPGVRAYESNGGAAVPPIVSSPPPPSGSRVALSGDLGVIPIGAVLQLLQIEAQSGVLFVGDGRAEITIVLRQGLIDLVQARGAGTEFRLGRYFVERGLVTPEDIERILRDRHAAALPASAPSRRLIGDLLVDSGRVTPEQLREGLARQSSELVYDVLRWGAGRFEFRREAPPPLAESARLGLPVASVVMEGFRRVDEWRLVEAGLGSFDSVLLADSTAVVAVGTERLAKAEQRLLHMIDGEKTVREIVEQSHMSSFDACKILYQLIEARLVRRRTL
jgi:CheY-like chemotaxis protein